MVKISRLGTSIGNLLRELRGDRSLRDIQKISGVSYTHLRSIEHGVDPRSGNKILPTPDTLKKLAKAYDYSYFELMEMSGYLGQGTAFEKETELINYEHRQQLHGLLEQALEILAENNQFCDFIKDELQHIWEEYEDAVDIGFEFTPDSIRSLIDETDYKSEWVWDLIKKLFFLARKEEVRIRLKRYEETLKDELASHDLANLLQYPAITYRSHPLTDQHRQLIAAYLDALFLKQKG